VHYLLTETFWYFILPFQVDLEHNHYRTFQGLTCLMQISTRTEDFIVDTLKLRRYLGDYLRDFFRDPTKRKVWYALFLYVYILRYV
jgi:ribonuclease D